MNSWDQALESRLRRFLKDEMDARSRWLWNSPEENFAEYKEEVGRMQAYERVLVELDNIKGDIDKER